MMRRRIYWIEPEGDELAAEFWIENDVLQVVWHDDLARKILERGLTIQTDVFTPSMGVVFFDALVALRRLSRFVVRDEDVEESAA